MKNKGKEENRGIRGRIRGMLINLERARSNVGPLGQAITKSLTYENYINGMTAKHPPHAEPFREMFVA